MDDADPYNGSMSVDDPQSFNRYAYVGNDPVNLTDPSGLDAVSEGVATARHALQGSACRSLFGNVNPNALIDDFLANGWLKVSSSYAFPITGNLNNRRNFLPGTGAITVGGTASVTRPDGVRESRSTITINSNGFFFTGRVSGIAINTVQSSGNYGLKLAQIRGLLIIHEFLHVANRIPGDDPSLPGGTAKSQRNSELVRMFCFSSLNKPDEPVSTDSTVPNTSLRLHPVLSGGGRSFQPNYGGLGGGWTSLGLLEVVLRSGEPRTEVTGYKLAPPVKR